MRCNDVAAKRGRFVSDPGSAEHIVYSGQMESDGTISLVKIAVENTDEIINSYYTSTTLEAILSRFMNGDMTALNRYQPIYGDLSDAPKNLAEALQVINNSRQAFDALPLSVREKFDYDFNKWIAAAGTDPWLDAMKPVIVPAESAPVEVVPDEVVLVEPATEK